MRKQPPRASSPPEEKASARDQARRQLARQIAHLVVLHHRVDSVTDELQPTGAAKPKSKASGNIASST